MIKKNSKKGWLIAVVVAIVAIGACVIDAFIPSNPVTFASKALRIKIPKGTTVIIDDYSEPSFPTGDGYSWTVLKIPPNKISEFNESLKTSPAWKPLPLSNELAQNDSCLQPELADGKIPILDTNGYYLLIDHQEVYNKEHNRHRFETEKQLCERYSQNFLFSLFDEKDGTLYIWSIDT